ncbi:MAG: ABC transporter substrate-binding protein [Polaromonas sp.]|nr:ABC transporter substrate-binding protein [Polaromonas sp.]
MTKPSIASEIAPTGRLRVAINLGNPVLAGKNPATGALCGISVDLARELAMRLGVDAELLDFDGAGKSVEAVRAKQADLGFFAIDPVRGEGVSFTPPYVVIEGGYLVPTHSLIVKNEEVDQAAHRVVVGAGSAYDLYLTRQLKHAQIVRAPTSPSVVPTFLDHQLEVAAGVKQQLQADALQFPGVRLLPGSFMTIYQAMGIPAARSPAALGFVSDFIEEMKATGIVAQLLRRHHIEGAVVAPPGYPPHG